MSHVVHDSDSSDSDIFVIKQIKPVNKLTLQQALIIKHGVLNSFQTKNNSPSHVTKERKKKRKKENDTNEKIEKPKKKKVAELICDKKTKAVRKLKRNSHSCVDNNVLSIKKGVEVTNANSSEDKKSKFFNEGNQKSNVSKISNSPGIKHYFNKEKVTPEKSKVLETSSVVDSDEIQLSPGINRRIKKFQIFKDKSSKSYKYNSVARKIFQEPSDELNEENCLTVCNDKTFSCSEENIVKLEPETELTEPAEGLKCHLQSFLDDACSQIHEENIKNNTELLPFLLKKIITDETKKQLKIEKESSAAGKVVEKLLSTKDCEILEKFLSLNETACKLYVRMLCRKKDWHRVTAIQYNDISNDLKNVFEFLHKENFVDVNINNEELEIQMGLLSKPEIQHLCKGFNVSKSTSVSKKNDLINLLIMSSSKQKSVLEMMSKKEKVSVLDLLKSEVCKLLGMCVKLNESVMSTFNKIMLLFSFPHYFDEEEKRFVNQMFLCGSLYRNTIKFPDYKLLPTVVFETRYDFEQYQRALYLLDLFNTAVSSKNHDDFVLFGNKAKEEFIRLYNDEKYKKRFMNLESFLKKFSAGTIYARILTKYCNTFKKKSNIKEIVSILEMLLGQNLFLTSKRGKWYETLSQAYETMKENSLAAEVIIKSLKDPCLDEVQKLTLQLRGQVLLKKKALNKNNKKSDLREELDDVCVISVREPLSIEIKARAVGGNDPGYKCIYFEENGSNKLYTSVEERAILYYKSNGFTKGYHVEGFIVQSIYFLLFFDIIYGESPPGVFQSSCQEAPLDFYSESFYTKRKLAIDSRLSEMCDWTIEVLEAKLNTVYYENLHKTCLITWKEHFSPEVFSEFIKCLTMPVLALICQRFVHNFRIAKSGFPDLTLWNLETKKCKFVEVKSPNDKLSPAQRMWLDYLRSIGIDCEVCNVKNTPVKSF